MAETKNGKPMAWIKLQVVEQEDGDLICYVTEAGPSRDDMTVPIDTKNIHMHFRHTTELSGPHMYRKLRDIIASVP